MKRRRLSTNNNNNEKTSKELKRKNETLVFSQDKKKTGKFSIRIHFLMI